jgi:hypothetical protein
MTTPEFVSCIQCNALLPSPAASYLGFKFKHVTRRNKKIMQIFASATYHDTDKLYDMPSLFDDNHRGCKGCLVFWVIFLETTNLMSPCRRQLLFFFCPAKGHSPSLAVAPAGFASVIVVTGTAGALHAYHPTIVATARQSDRPVPGPTVTAPIFHRRMH